MNNIDKPFYKHAISLGTAGALSGVALGLSKKIGEAYSKHNAHIATNALSDLFTSPISTYKTLTKSGWNYFGDVINNFGHSLSQI